MIMPAHARAMAAYNTEMNRRLYAAAATLSEAQRREDGGAFFGSIHGTLCHLLWGDRVWMHRFAGWERPWGGIAGRCMPCSPAPAWPCRTPTCPG